MNTGDEENITTSFYKGNLTLQNIKFRKLIARPSENSVRILKSKYLGLLIPYTCCVCYIFFVIVSATIQALAIISGSYVVKLEQYLFFLLLLFERRRVWWRTSKIGFKDIVRYCCYNSLLLSAREQEAVISRQSFHFNKLKQGIWKTIHYMISTITNRRQS